MIMGNNSERKKNVTADCAQPLFFSMQIALPKIQVSLANPTGCICWAVSSLVQTLLVVLLGRGERGKVDAFYLYFWLHFEMSA